MIIGHGMMAKACSRIDREDILFYASGVSNSLETSKLAFDKEERLLQECLTKYIDKTFVYFGTVSLPNSITSTYINHKQKMCDLIMQKTHNFIILKLSQVVGKEGNCQTLFNYLLRELRFRNPILIYEKTYRSLIDVDDVVVLLKKLIDNKYLGVHTFYGVEPMLVKNIVLLMSRYLKLPCHLIVIKGEEQGILQNSETVNLLLNDIDCKGYTKRLIQKYIKLKFLYERVN